MDSTVPRRAMTPMTMAEMLPALGGILSKDTMQTLTAKKQPRSKLAATRTSEKTLKPMTIAEIRAVNRALKVQSPRSYAQAPTSVKKKWNSSVKVEKKIVSHTANGQMKHNSVRKVLNFQHPKPKIPVITYPRMTMNPETSKTPKPEIKDKKSVHLQAYNILQISGICHIPETPQLLNKPIKNRMTIANKENISKYAVINKKIPVTPKSSQCKRLIASRVPDTPLSNESWKSSCDDSFIRNEKDLEIVEGKTKALSQEPVLENIEDISPPVSTPFKEYRNVKEFFNNSSDVMDSSTSYHNSIICFDKKSLSKENSKREESVIVSLCDLLNKATVSKTDKASAELDYLLEVERQTENNIKLIENVMESQLKSLQYVRKMISEKQKLTSESDNDKTVIEASKDAPKVIVTAITPKKSPVLSKPCSVLKSCMKSPSYKIPRKSCMRKKVLYKSLPNVSNLMVTPPKEMGDRALSMYLKMKEHMDFLNTPVVKQRPLNVPDTPAITSHNLQMQLDNLYGES